MDTPKQQTPPEPFKFDDWVRLVGTPALGRFYEWRGPRALVRFPKEYRELSPGQFERPPR